MVLGFFSPVIAAAIVQGVASWYAQRRSERFAANMSNTAHQREVRDLRAAGLNPLLSANQGASSPTAPMDVPDFVGAAATAKKVSLAKELQSKQIGLIDVQSEVGRAQAEKLRTESQVLAEETGLRGARLKREQAIGDFFEELHKAGIKLKDFISNPGLGDFLIRLLRPGSNAKDLVQGVMGRMGFEEQVIYGPNDTIPPGTPGHWVERDGIRYFVSHRPFMREGE